MFNILLTDKCSGKCPYCFAAVFMRQSLKRREMSLRKLARVLDFIRKNCRDNAIKLLGGEPTLHSQLESVLRLILKKGFTQIKIFSNGIIAPGKIKLLEKYQKNITFIWNVNPPGTYPAGVDRQIKETVSKFSSAKNVLGFNIYQTKYDPSFIYRLLDLMPHFKHVRIGIAHPIGDVPHHLDDGNHILIKDYPKVGAIIYQIIKKINRDYPAIKQISLDCGYTPCLFTGSQLSAFRNMKAKIYFAPCTDAVSVDSNLRLSSCFSVPKTYGNVKLTDFKNLQQIKKYFLAQLVFEEEYLPDVSQKCKKCQSKNSCFGGCRGERYLLFGNRSRKIKYARS